MAKSRSSGPAAKVSDVVQRSQQHDSAADLVDVFGVMIPAADAAEFKRRATMSALAAIRHEKPSVPPSSPPATPEFEDVVPDVAVLNTPAGRSAAAMLAKRKEIEESRRLFSAMVAGDPQNDALRAENEALRQRLRDTETRSMFDTMRAEFDRRFTSLESKIANNGHAVATVQDPTGLVLVGANLTKDIYKVASDTRAADNEFSVQSQKLGLQAKILDKREERDAQQREREMALKERESVHQAKMGELVIEKIERGFDAFAKPVIQHRLGIAPQGGQAATTPATSPPAIEDQLLRLRVHRAEVDRVEAQLVAQLQAQGQDVNPADGLAPLTPTGPAPDVVHPTPDSTWSPPGTIHRRER